MVLKNGCQAKIILGSRLHRLWATCEVRLNGTCCKDCKYLNVCELVCSHLYPYWGGDSKTCDFLTFQCPYFCTKLEAVFKRLDIDS